MHATPPEATAAAVTPLRIDWVLPDPIPTPPDVRAFSAAELQGIRRDYFENAVRRWGYVVRGWPLAADGATLRLPNGQPFTALKIHVVFKDFGTGPGGTVARVPADGVQRLQPSQSQPFNFAWEAVLEIDQQDVQFIRTAPSRFFDTIVHEIGHALGIGTRWSDGPPMPELVIQRRGRWFYTGPAGRAAYEQMTGTAFGGIPLDPDALIPGAFHWSERRLRLEIMSPELDVSTVDQVPRGGRVAISAISVGALQDLGYVVNMAAAERLRLDP